MPARACFPADHPIEIGDSFLVLPDDGVEVGSFRDQLQGQSASVFTDGAQLAHTGIFSKAGSCRDLETGGCGLSEENRQAGTTAAAGLEGTHAVTGSVPVTRGTKRAAANVPVLPLKRVHRVCPPLGTPRFPQGPSPPETARSSRSGSGHLLVDASALCQGQEQPAAAQLGGSQPCAPRSGIAQVDGHGPGTLPPGPTSQTRLEGRATPQHDPVSAPAAHPDPPPTCEEPEKRILQMFERELQQRLFVEAAVSALQSPPSAALLPVEERLRKEDILRRRSSSSGVMEGGHLQYETEAQRVSYRQLEFYSCPRLPANMLADLASCMLQRY